MAQRLSDIRPGDNALGEGVSLVHRGANRRTFLLAKSAEEVDADITALLAEPGTREGALLDAVRKAGGDESVEKAAAGYARLAEGLREAFGADGIPAEVLKAMQSQLNDDMNDDDLEDGELNEDDVEKALAKLEEVAKADFTAEQRQEMARNGEAMSDGSYPIPNRDYLEKAIHAVGRGKNNSHDAIRAHIVKRAKALGATSLLPDSWNVQKEDRMSETAVPVKKEDGTYDLSAIPEDARAAVEAVLKERDDRDAELVELRKTADEQKSKADEAIEIAKSERDARETKEFVAKSAGYENIAKTDTEFGEVLKSIHRAEQDKHLPDGTLAALETVLKAADEQIAKGDLFAEQGHVGGGSSDAESKVDAVIAEIRKADPSLTREQAYDQALKNDPSLYDEIRKEQA